MAYAQDGVTMAGELGRGEVETDRANFFGRLHRRFKFSALHISCPIIIHIEVLYNLVTKCLVTARRLSRQYRYRRPMIDLPLLRLRKQSDQ
jgi:hypothetical protein